MFKKILTIVLATLSFFVVLSLAQPTIKASGYWNDHERRATTAVPLKMVFWGRFSENGSVKLLSKSDLKAIGKENTTIAANTRVAISTTAFKKGKIKYYSVRFISKRYLSDKYSGNIGLFPCLEVTNHKQLKNVKNVKLAVEN